MKLSVVIPTYLREQVLIDTCAQLLEHMDPVDMELLVIDQTPLHESQVKEWLQINASQGKIRHIRQNTPSLTQARNTGLIQARGEIVLFLDDDVIIHKDLLENNLRWYRSAEIGAVTGEVYNCTDPLNPPPLDHPELGTRRHSGINVAQYAKNTSGGNHSVRRLLALSSGGYDEQFVGSALAEDLDFSQRLMAAGGKIWYDPEAWIIHLGLKSGGCGVSGTRIWPEWMHSANLLLYAFRHGKRQKNTVRFLWMSLRNGPLRKEIIIRPWRWPGAVIGFVRGLVYGWRHRHPPPPIMPVSSRNGF
ncbi:MAG TPA: glycosyltransferase [Kiritimatiellia bacterium]|nr:glycosyltransferase [Kiritimatiellia bacterium]